MSDKPLVWVGSSLDDTRSFPVAARRAAGYQLYRVQMGLTPTDWKPIPAIGAGVCEIRLHAGTEHRIVYVARFAEAVYVLHAFRKTTRATRKADIELARTRLSWLITHRRKQEEG